MAQRLGHPSAQLFWVLAIPSYIGGAICLRLIYRIIEQLIWYHRLMRRAAPSG